MINSEIFLTSTYGVKMQREGVDVFLRPVIPAGRENIRADTGSLTEVLSAQPRPSCAGCREHMLQTCSKLNGAKWEASSSKKGKALLV